MTEVWQYSTVGHSLPTELTNNLLLRTTIVLSETYISSDAKDARVRPVVL